MLTTEVNLKDPRVIRTRQLIIDAFVLLLGKQDFHSITVSDISKQATINRATFYAHFPDKYALIEEYLSSSFIEFIYRRVDKQADLTEETVTSIIIGLCEYHEASNKRCMRNYDTVASLVEKSIIAQLEKFILQMMVKNCEETQKDILEIAANMLTWSIYGSTYRWNRDRRTETPQQFAIKIMPMIKGYIE
ncbi:TetR/AcrR family transcriptional regulator [Paenibacillus sp. NPDC058174]|uniref:TetR/AcrR family transcriptional regulator n=1 Tax=Paenibacillus sp. NPDC058174 TaxID=3346366 RepID=UPI0036DB1855